MGLSLNVLCSGTVSVKSSITVPSTKSLDGLCHIFRLSPTFAPFLIKMVTIFFPISSISKLFGMRKTIIIFLCPAWANSPSGALRHVAVCDISFFIRLDLRFLHRGEHVIDSGILLLKSVSHSSQKKDRRGRVSLSNSERVANSLVV